MTCRWPFALAVALISLVSVSPAAAAGVAGGNENNGFVTNIIASPQKPNQANPPAANQPPTTLSTAVASQPTSQNKAQGPVIMKFPSDGIDILQGTVSVDPNLVQQKLNALIGHNGDIDQFLLNADPSHFNLNKLTSLNKRELSLVPSAPKFGLNGNLHLDFGEMLSGILNILGFKSLANMAQSASKAIAKRDMDTWWQILKLIVKTQKPWYCKRCKLCYFLWIFEWSVLFPLFLIPPFIPSFLCLSACLFTVKRRYGACIMQEDRNIAAKKGNKLLDSDERKAAKKAQEEKDD